MFWVEATWFWLNKMFKLLNIYADSKQSLKMESHWVRIVCSRRGNHNLIFQTNKLNTSLLIISYHSESCKSVNCLPTIILLMQL